MKPRNVLSIVCLSLMLAQTPAQAQNYPAPVEDDFIISDFHFHNGEVLPQLKIHYRTIGNPVKDGAGVVRNSVLIGHGTGGAGTSFLSPQFAGVLFGPGQPLDAARYFIILPDGIGHGKSSKPSDGLHARFPHYTYDDMVAAQYELLTKKLGVNHLRLVMGTSMGAMHAWVWGETYPDFMDALMPLASNPIELAGRNYIWRRMAMDSIRNDPEWLGGEYKTQPTRALIAAENLLLLAINSADDFINPPELGIIEREIKRVKNGRFVLLPVTDQTRGHGTHSLPAIWQGYLKELLKSSER